MYQEFKVNEKVAVIRNNEPDHTDTICRITQNGSCILSDGSEYDRKGRNTKSNFWNQLYIEPLLPEEEEQEETGK